MDRPRSRKLALELTPSRLESSSAPLTGRANRIPKRDDNKLEDHPWIQILKKVLLSCLVLAVSTTVLYFQVKSWPRETRIYYTNNPLDTERGELTYTCGCSLPSNMQSAENPSTTDGHGNLNVCYESSSLETVTVLMYSKSTAAAVLDPIISLSNMEVWNKTVEGYTVSQEAYDLSNQLLSGAVPDDLTHLYLGGYQQLDIYPEIEFLQGPEFVSFPTSYVRMGFHYTCDNCNTCGLDTVNNISKTVVANEEVWATCYPWLRAPESQCGNSSSYEGKCLLYPPQALPANLAIQRFLQLFLNLPGIQKANVTPADSNVHQLIDCTNFQPSFLYLNVSQVISSSIGLGFVEVFQSSALWVSLLELIPTLDNECANLQTVQACNGTSICNVFTKANSYDQRCLDMTNKTQCLDLQSDAGLSVDNVANLISSSGDPKNNIQIICPTFKCQAVPPYSAIWSTSKQMENDAINQFLSAELLSDEWAKRAGVCTNTYSLVFRYQPGTSPGEVPEGAKARTSDRYTMFLETNCTSGRSNGTSTYCWPTGYYHNLTDSPEEPPKRLPEDLFWASNNLFVCYRVQRQGFPGWFITTFGILFGWLGSMQLLYQSLLWVIRKIDRKRDERNTSPVFPGAEGK